MTKNLGIRVPGPDKLGYNIDVDARAKKEADAYTKKRDLEKVTNEHKRNEEIRDVISSGTLWLIRAIIFSVFITIIVVAFHHLAPENWQWLSEGQLADLRTVLFSGAVVGAVSSYVQRHAT